MEVIENKVVRYFLFAWASERIRFVQLENSPLCMYQTVHTVTYLKNNKQPIWPQVRVFRWEINNKNKEK